MNGSSIMRGRKCLIMPPSRCGTCDNLLKDLGKGNRESIDIKCNHWESWLCNVEMSCGVSGLSVIILYDSVNKIM